MSSSQSPLDIKLTHHHLRSGNALQIASLSLSDGPTGSVGLFPFTNRNIVNKVPAKWPANYTPAVRDFASLSPTGNGTHETASQPTENPTLPNYDSTEHSTIRPMPRSWFRPIAAPDSQYSNAREESFSLLATEHCGVCNFYATASGALISHLVVCHHLSTHSPTKSQHSSSLRFIYISD